MKEQKNVQKVEYLKSLFRIEKNILGLLDCHPMLHGFYDFLEKSGLEKDAYESFVLGLYKEELIEVDLCGYKDLEHATVWPKKAASDYIAEHEGKQTIGF